LALVYIYSVQEYKSYNTCTYTEAIIYSLTEHIL
jgi:hypothetical protein